jgi:hypothetical protein
LYRYKRRRTLPAIPHPEATIASMHSTIMALVEAVEMLQGQRGTISDAAVSWGELVDQGVLKLDQVPMDVGTDSLRRQGVGGTYSRGP